MTISGMWDNARSRLRFAAAGALLFFLAAVASGADNAFSGLKPGDKIVCGGVYAGHLQGVDTDGSSIYWVFTKCVVRTGTGGKVLAKRAVKGHAGDPCWYNGRLYVPVAQGSFNRELKKGEASKNYIYEFTPELKLVKIHHVPQVGYGVGCIAAHKGRFFISGGRPQGKKGNTVYEYSVKFKFRRKHELGFDSVVGIQTIKHLGGRWYFGCYGTGGMTIVTDDDFRVSGRVRPLLAVGMIEAADGLVLKGDVEWVTPDKTGRGVLRAVRLVPVKNAPTAPAVKP